MANRLQRFMRSVLLGVNNTSYNKFNEAFLGWIGGNNTTYDDDGVTYIDKGYNLNSVVYSIINQQATKTSSIPYTVQEIDDEQSKCKYKQLIQSTKGDLTPQQLIKRAVLKTKAYKEKDLQMPLDRPNPNQTWIEFHNLYKTFIAANGNVYLYLLTPKEGLNKGVPIAIYILPSHLMEIVLKEDVNLLGAENPIKSYMLIDGKQYIEFESENVIHIKLSNPNYDESGSHLYGQSRLRAGLKNIENSNKAVELGGKTLQNGGAFGFLHGTKTPLTPEQAKEIKERLTEMNTSTEDLGKIQGASSELGFTRVSLTTAELQPFEYLKYDEKQIANVLGWSDKLLNNDSASTMNNIDNERKRVITDNIHPDLMLLAEALNREFLPRFKGYENTEIVYDISELPEMQPDVKKLVEWAVLLLDRGALNRNELRDIVSFSKLEDDIMDVYTVNNDLLTLEEAIDSEFRIDG